jgi:hypothetical protein
MLAIRKNSGDQQFQCPCYNYVNTILLCSTSLLVTSHAYFFKYSPHDDLMRSYPYTFMQDIMFRDAYGSCSPTRVAHNNVTYVFTSM